MISLRSPNEDIAKLVKINTAGEHLVKNCSLNQILEFVSELKYIPESAGIFSFYSPGPINHIVRWTIFYSGPVSLRIGLDIDAEYSLTIYIFGKLRETKRLPSKIQVIEYIDQLCETIYND